MNSNNSRGSGAGLAVEVLPLTVTNRVVFGWNSDGGYSLKLMVAGELTFTEEVDYLVRFALARHSAACSVRFKKPMQGGTNWLQLQGGIEAHFEDVLNAPSSTFYSTGYSATHFHVPGNRISTVYESNGPIHLWAENAWPASVNQLKFTSDNAGLNLHGYDQLVTKMPAFICGSAKTGVTSEDPAMMRFEGANISSLVFKGLFSGAAGLCWNPSNASREFCFSNVVQTTSGSVIVSNGVVRLTSGAAFHSLSNLVVASGARFEFDPSAPLAQNICHISVADGGQVVVPANIVLTCQSCVSGSVTLGSGEHVASEIPGFSGAGSVIVVDIPADGVRWVGGQDGDWNDDANWSTGAKPASGDVVYVANAGTVSVPVDIPEFSRLIVDSGTVLVSTNWTTCLRTTSLEIRDGGKLTCRGAWTNEADSARVWVSCGTLLVYGGGAIDVTGCGWSAGPHTGSTTWSDGWWGRPGFGPGAGIRCRGASHGGYGGLIVGDNGVYPTLEYGNAEEPDQAGSGGYGYNAQRQSHGGGAVRIEATGAVWINGTVSADAIPGHLSSSTSPIQASAGAGGSVWITCSKISGRGTVSANGGDGTRGFAPTWAYPASMKADSYSWGGRPGGGGRIAVHYDVEQQTVAEASSLSFSAKAGIHKCTDLDMRIPASDDCRNGADLGTVWFSDSKLFEATFGQGLSGRVVTAPKNWTIKGDFTFSSGWVRLPVEGVTLSVTGDFAVDGADTRLELGGVCATTRTARIDIYGGAATNRLLVGGNFTVTGGAGFDVRSGAVADDPELVGAIVSVGGNLSVSNSSRIVCWSDVCGLGSPRFVVDGDFAVAAGGLVTADFRGGSGAWKDSGYVALSGSNPEWGCGFGAGTNAVGGSYGGLGGANASLGTSVPSPTYGDAFRPYAAGSGGGCFSWGHGGSGGGIVRVMAAGNLVVDGKISACGDPSQNNNGYGGSGSGGVVFLSGRNFSGSGSLVADGGIAYQKNAVCAPSGGGGRVVVWTGEPYATGLAVNAARSRRVIRSASPLENPDSGAPVFSGCTSAIGGTNLLSDVSMPAGFAGSAGSVQFCQLLEPVGALIIVR